MSENSDSQQPCRKRLKCIAEAAVARRKLYFPAVAANSPSVTVSYIYACIVGNVVTTLYPQVVVSYSKESKYQ